MKKLTIPGGAWSLSPDRLRNHPRKQLDELQRRENFAQTLSSHSGLYQPFLKHDSLTWQAVAGLPLFETMRGSQYPGAEPGIFFDSEYLWRTPVDQEKETDPFHDSESADIYDLYNACNGIIRDNLLDVGQLDKYSAAEAQALDIPRLREIWEHTRSGCSQCEDIIAALAIVRKMIGEDTGNAGPNNGPGLDIDHIDSIS